MRIVCENCGKKFDKSPGEVNRARKGGYRLFCGRRCSGLARRSDTRTVAQKRADKATYDAEYRRKNRGLLKRKKAAYFKRTYDPVKAAVERKKNMPRHVAYCRRPEYKRWKKGYDRKYRAKKLFGPFAEAAMLLTDLNHEIKGRMTNEQIAIANQTFNKAQRRRRASKEEPTRTRPRFRDRRDRHQAPFGG